MRSSSLSTKLCGTKAAALTLCLAASGCASVAPSVPQDIALTGNALEVRSAGRMYQPFRDGYFDVGNYKVTGIHHGVNKGNELSIGQYSQASATGKFQFLLTGPRSAWTARCHRLAWSRSISVNRVGVGIGNSGLQCELANGDQRATLELNDVTQIVHGFVRIGNDSYDLRQYFHDTPELGKAYVPGPLGLRIDRSGQNVAALALARPGTFWLNRTLAPDHQDALAGVLAALLIDARR